MARTNTLVWCQHEQVVTAPLPQQCVNIGMYCQQALALNARTTTEWVERAHQITHATGAPATDATLETVEDRWHFLPAAATFSDFVAWSRTHCFCNRVHDVTGDDTRLLEMIMCTTDQDLAVLVPDRLTKMRTISY